MSFAKNGKYLIETPNGFEHFDGVQKVERHESVVLHSSDGQKLECSPSHKIKTTKGWVEAEWITEGDEVETTDGVLDIVRTEHKINEVDLFDIINSGDDHCYYSNGFLSHNCQFIGSASTLISPTKLQSISYRKPIRKKDDVDFYEEPREHHRYIVTVDCARGMRLDYSAFVVIDVTQIPYRVVAKFRSNIITPMIYPQFIFNVANYFNTAYVLVEANDVGAQVVEALAMELGYEHVLKTIAKGRAGYQLGDGHGAKLGVTTSASVKKKGCSNFKSLIETDKLIVEDYEIFVEMTTFTRKNDNIQASFEAEPGTNDDLVMCMVLFSWCVGSEYWKELTDTDVSTAMYNDKLVEEEADQMPMGFIGNDRMNEMMMDASGSVWEIVSDEDSYYPDTNSSPSNGNGGGSWGHW